MKAIFDEANAAFLRANNEAYEWIIEKIQAMDRQSESEAVLRRIIVAARFAAMFHSGRFADGAIENVVLEIGSKIGDLVTEDDGFKLPPANKKNRRRILHVATDVLGIGGHTRMLNHWIRNDQDSCHSVLLINQPDAIPVPRWLSDGVKRSEGELVIFPASSELCRQAKWLRETAKRLADLVVLHHCPFDVVPTIAFAVRECPPVAILNHADHIFWLGSSVADMVINLRTVASEHTAIQRFVAKNTVLPIPLTVPMKQLPYKDARQVLGIPENQVVLLSVGRAEKYRPCGSYDFVSTAGKILDRHPDAHLYIVGESAPAIVPYLRCSLHNRIHFVGCIEDPVEYWMAADVYLESFPFGSNTALLEAALCGLPVVPAYAPLFPLLVANNDAICDILRNPINEEEYINQVELLIWQPDLRAKLGALLKDRLLVDHATEGWLKRLAKVYQETDVLTHDPQPIAISQCKATEADISLSLWHVMADGKTHSTDTPTNLSEAIFHHTSFVAKEVGNYPSALQNAWHAVSQNPIQWKSWRLFGVSLLGKSGPFIRRMMSHV